MTNDDIVESVKEAIDAARASGLTRDEARSEREAERARRKEEKERAVVEKAALALAKAQLREENARLKELARAQKETEKLEKKNSGRAKFENALENSTKEVVFLFDVVKNSGDQFQFTPETFNDVKKLFVLSTKVPS